MLINAAKRLNLWTQCPEVKADIVKALRSETKNITYGHSVHKLKAERFE